MQLKQIKGLHAFILYQPTDPQKGSPNPEISCLSNHERQNTQNNQREDFIQAITIRKISINGKHLKEKDGDLWFYEGT